MDQAISKVIDLINGGAIVSTDSRKIQKNTNTVFIALKGEHHNGNTFAKQAIKKGAVLAVIDNPKYENENTLLVDDTLEFLQKLSLEYRKQFKVKVIAITGSNGKTTTKDLVRDVLSKKYKVIATQGNLNNHIGLPLTLLNIKPEHDFAIIEMGASHQGEIRTLCEIALPNYGIITNIGKAHLEGFGGFDGVVKTKSELYDYIRDITGKVFVHKTNSLLMQLSQGIEQILYGDHDLEEELRYSGGEHHFLHFETETPKAEYEIKTQLVGDYNYENVLAAISVGETFDVDTKDITEAIAEYQPLDKRSQWYESEKNKIIIDYYNANPSSMRVAIDNFLKLETDKKLMILGDMLELGDSSSLEHHAIIDAIRNVYKCRIILVGKEFWRANSGSFMCFKDIDETLAFFYQNPVNDHTILIKGSRGMKMENLLSVL